MHSCFLHAVSGTRHAQEFDLSAVDYWFVACAGRSACSCTSSSRQRSPGEGSCGSSSACRPLPAGTPLNACTPAPACLHRAPDVLQGLVTYTPGHKSPTGAPHNPAPHYTEASPRFWGRALAPDRPILSRRSGRRTLHTHSAHRPWRAALPPQGVRSASDGPPGFRVVRVWLGYRVHC